MQQQQNWEYTTLTQKKAPSANKAQQQGMSVTAVNKGKGANHHNLDAKYVATVLNDEDMNFKVPEVSHDFKLALQQARNAKGLTQDQLAKLISEKKAVIHDLERGTTVPSPHVISKLNQALGTKLPKACPKNK